MGVSYGILFSLAVARAGLNVAGIVGGVSAAVILIVIVAAVFYWRRKKTGKCKSFCLSLLLRA
jgi:hypothetical protein